MALSIKHPLADELARELAAVTGETLTDAVLVALRERLERLRSTLVEQPLSEQLLLIGARCSQLPLLDARAADDIVGYDEDGLPA